MQRSFNGTLAELSELRKNPMALRPLQAMGWALSIPEPDYAILCKILPDLVSRDHWTRNQAMKKFIESPASLPYRVRDHKSRISYSNRPKKPQEPTRQRGDDILEELGLNRHISWKDDILLKPG